MNLCAILARLRHDRRGATIIEFAFAAPVLIVLIVGAIQVGMQMQNYNAMRSVIADTGRFTLVQYQKGNRLSDAQIEQSAFAIAVNAPYGLKGNRLDVAASEDSSEITGARKVELTMRYTTLSFLTSYGIDPINLTYTRPIYVPASTTP